MKKSVNGSNILVLGLSYKKDIADTRESPALDIITLLQTRGANISWNDPYISDYPNTPALTVVKDLTPSSLNTADCVVIITDHSSYDWASIVTHSHLIIDTRNATKHTISSWPCHKIVTANVKTATHSSPHASMIDTHVIPSRLGLR
ncbi:MAG TPA: hypothetical protein EYQ00_03155 [Dehalococcoidia bacterium]|nr:hypothetical protein [Dehalococcoidia bacterium]